MTDEGTNVCKRRHAGQHRTMQAANRGWARGHNVRALGEDGLLHLPVVHGLRILETCAPHASNLRSALAHVRDSAAHHSMRAATYKLAKTLHAIKPEKALLHNVRAEPRTPAWRLARWTDDGLSRKAGQVPWRWASVPAKG